MTTITLARFRAHLTARKCRRTVFAVLAVLFYLTMPVRPATAAVGFVDYAAGEAAVPLAPYMEYLVDESGRLDIDGIFTQAKQSQFSPLSAGLPLNLSGTLWLRFTLPPLQPGAEPPFLRLDLGRDAPAGAVLYMPDGNLNAALTTWIPQSSLEKNIFILQFLGLTLQAQTPVTAYVRIPGAVSLWFAPQLLTSPAASLEQIADGSWLNILGVMEGWLLSPSSALVYLVLGLLTVLCLFRAFRLGGEWRLWTAVFAVLVILDGMVPMPYAPAGKISLQALLNVVIPGLCFILLIHTGRHLLQSKARCKGVDAGLVALSLLGVALPIIPLLPGMIGWLRAIALWPVLAILPALASLAAAAKKIPGAKRYALACFLIFLGGLAAWWATGLARPAPYLSQAPLWAAAIFVFLVGVTRIPLRAEAPAAEDAAGAEILRLDDLVGGESLDLPETIDELLPPRPDAAAAAPEDFDRPAPEPSEPDHLAGGFLSLRPADPGADASPPLKLIPKLATLDIPERFVPAPAEPAGSGTANTAFAAPDEDAPLELKDIVTDTAAAFAAAAGETPAAQDDLGRSDGGEAPGAAETGATPQAGAAPARDLPAMAAETAGNAPGPAAEPADADAADSPDQPLAAPRPEPDQPALATTALAAEFVSEARPVAPEGPGDQADDELKAALPWRQPLGGAKKGIDMIGELILGAGGNHSAKEPVLIGPDLLNAKAQKSPWDGEATAAGHTETPEATPPEPLPPAASEKAAAGPEFAAGLPDGAAAASLPGKPEPPVIGFADLVDETAHADVLWTEAQATQVVEPLPIAEDDWKLSDMGRHGQAAAGEKGAMASGPAPDRPQEPAAAQAQDVPEKPDLTAIQTDLAALLDALKNVAPELPEALREQSQSVLESGREILANLNAPRPEPTAEPTPREVTFDLQLVLCDAHDAVRATAEAKNLALSWFMPPHLPLLYQGDPVELQAVLRQLLESSIAATERGSVQLSVRRVPDSTDPGHLIFCVSDSGQKQDAAQRNPFALRRAWNLAARLGGGLNVESAPGQGSMVAFTVHLQRPAEDMYGGMPGLETESGMLGLHSGGAGQAAIVSRQKNQVLIVDEQATNRQLIAFFLGNLPYQVVEAKSLEQGLALYRAQPAGLVILDSRLEGLDMAAAVKQMRETESSFKLSPAPVVALVQEHDEIAAMLGAGCKGALRKPLSRKRVRDLILALLPLEDPPAHNLPDDDGYGWPGSEQAEEAVLAPAEGSPEAYVGGLGFSPTEDDAAPAGLGGRENAAPAPGRDPEPGDAAENRPRNLMGALEMLNFEAGALGDSPLPPEPADSEAEEPDTGRPAPEDIKWETPQPRNARPKRPMGHNRVPAETAGTAQSEVPGQPAATAAEKPAAAVVKAGWLSGILGAANKMAGARADRPERDAAAISLGDPIPLDAESLKNAEPEQLDRIPEVLEGLEIALGDARHGLGEENALAVSRACLCLADIAANHNLDNLSRIARCVERAAQANDLEAVADLLAELEASLDRTRHNLETVLENSRLPL